MKRMLINATQAEERRLAIVDGQKLLDYEIEIEGREQRKGNIYKAVVTRVEPSLEACFVDYGEERHGFLPFKEISKQYFSSNVSASQARIQGVIKEGQDLLIQVEKEERGNKGAALTTFISLAGRYVVLMPNNPRGGGVSRRIEGDDRAELKEAMDQLEYPNGMSIIARTAGIGRSAPELQWDLNYLLKLWTAIDGASKSKGAFLIYQESSLVIRAIRDYFNNDIGDILIDTDDIYDQAQQFMAHVMPEHAARVKRYRDETPLFSRFQIEHQIESAYARTVNLPSGGAIVIDHTEALVSVDVNSARAIKGGDIEETATRTNLEAADEVARQMRLRDLGGLIVIDFIDMEERKNNAAVEKRLKEKLKTDRARIQVGRISGFGLMEMSRQRLRPGMLESTTQPCQHCHGTGLIRSDDSMALTILRALEEEGTRKRSKEVLLRAPVGIVNYLYNQKREHIALIEARYGMAVRIEADPKMISPDYTLDKFKTATRLVQEMPSAVISGNASLMGEAVEEEDPEIPAEEDEAEEAEAPAAEARSEARTEANGNGEGGKKKRRRRRRRRNGAGGQNGAAGDAQGSDGDGPDDEGDTEGEIDGDDADTPEATPAPEPVAAVDAPAEEPAAKPKTTRTRSRSKAKPAEATPDAPAEAAPEAGEKPKTTRSRSRKPKADPEPEAASPAPMPAPEPAPAPAMVEEPVAVAAAPEAPAPAAMAAEAPATEAPAPEAVATQPAAEPEGEPKPKRKGWWSLAR